MHSIKMFVMVTSLHVLRPNINLLTWSPSNKLSWKFENSCPIETYLSDFYKQFSLQ